MFRISLCTFLLLSLLLFAVSADASGNKFILPEEERDDTVKIEVDTSNILIEAFSGKENFRRVSPDSFAGVLGRPTQNIRWYPAADPENRNRMLIRETSQSFDNSVIVFVESTGKTDGPKGSRILFVDTVNLIVLKMLELPFRVSEVRCQGSSGKIWYLRTAQPDTLNDSSGFGIIDAKTGETLTEKKLQTLPKRMYPHFTGQFAWILEKNQILRLFPNGKKELFLKLPEIREMKVSPDCMYLAVVTEKETRLYSAMDASLIYRVKLVPDQTFVFLSGEPPRLLLGQSISSVGNLAWPERLYLVTNGAPRLIFSNLSGSVVADPSGRVFYSIKPKNRIEKRNSTTGQYMSSYMVTSLKPDTPGKPEMLFHAAENGYFLIFDTVGGLNKIDATPRRWKKIGMMRPWTE